MCERPALQSLVDAVLRSDRDWEDRFVGAAYAVSKLHNSLCTWGLSQMGYADVEKPLRRNVKDPYEMIVLHEHRTRREGGGGDSATRPVLTEY